MAQNESRVGVREQCLKSAQIQQNRKPKCYGDIEIIDHMNNLTKLHVLVPTPKQDTTDSVA